MLIGLETSKDRRSFSGIAVWVNSKKENMVCLSSGESELMALVGGACEGIATRDPWSNLCKCSLGTIVLYTDNSAALGLVKRKGASRRTRHVDSKVYFVQAWAVADCLTKITTPRAAHRKALGI